MTTQITVPSLGESVSEATVAKWLKKAGDVVCVDEPLAELETDKVTVEVNAPQTGVLVEIKAAKGQKVAIGAVIGILQEDAAEAHPAGEIKDEEDTNESSIMETLAKIQRIVMPAARKQAADMGINADAVNGTGRGGRVTKEDVMIRAAMPVAAPASGRAVTNVGRENRVKMSRLRQRIAERLKEAQNSAAILTTFNEVDMSAVMSLREVSKGRFEKKHGVKLGIMSFFVKACVHALKEFPSINAEINGEDVIYKNYYDIGVAVGTDSGLVVPVIRDADALDFHEIENKISDLGSRAKDGKISIEELSGGTFTITNGGIYGSLMSTPIINPPQSAILGMHAIKDRPVAIDGRVEIRPMMYLALSYDHRLIDGREAVSFLMMVKDTVENPARLLLDA